MTPNAQTIVIIGGGFSGAITAVNLLRRAPSHGLRVVLINRSGRMARGIAFGTRSAEHVLNVPAGNMSALAEDAEDFLRFCRWSHPEVEPSSFVLRRLYGTYLEALLTSAEHSCAEHVQLERVSSEVVRIDVDDTAARARVLLIDGQVFTADHVVLAFGHFAPANPPVATPSFYDSPRYVRDPWGPGVLQAIGGDDPVLLVGSGLTAVDVALALQRSGRTAPILCVSRRGLLPQAHRASRGAHRAVGIEDLLRDMGATVRRYVAAVRRHARQRAGAGEDWRELLAALRPHTPALWHRLPARERARFLRHVQPYWDVLRHRCAPEAHARFSQLLATGAVAVVAGRIAAFQEEATGVDVGLRLRGSSEALKWRAAWVINCTGSDSNLQRVHAPLVRELLAQRLIRPDALGLGLDVGDNYGVVDAQGRISRVLHYIGPLLKARDWEATAVPELREHALHLANLLLAQARFPAA